MKIDTMHQYHGVSQGNFCKDCCNFHTGRISDKIYHKCEAYGMTHSEASDWRVKYQACGLYNKPFNSVLQRTGMDLKRRVGKHEVINLEGQTEL